MKRLAKWLGVLVGMLIVGTGIGLGYLRWFLPDGGPARMAAIEATPSRLQRGAYLAHHVAGCLSCHSQRDWNYFAGPIVAGSEGGGGERFGEEDGLPGTFYAGNITPASLKSWTDGEILRAVAGGVDRRGEPLFPVMPYPNYGQMDREDAYAIIAYLRTLKPIDSTPPPSQAHFPMNWIMRTMPKPPQFQAHPKETDTVAYGEYLTRLASCAHCHTPAEKGKPLPGMDFAGGRVFRLQGQVVRSANITPDAETGIGAWTTEEFVKRFKAHDPATAKPMPLKPGQANTLMPWIAYAGMAESDLQAIHAYLRTIPPVRHAVERFAPDASGPIAEAVPR